MPACWTCGAPTESVTHRCHECKSLAELDQIGDDLEQGFHSEGVRDHVQIAMQIAQLQAMERLKEATKQGFQRVCNMVRWSTTEITWRLDQQSDTLRSIDNTLKSPIETQSSEFRKMAEQLSKRGVLDDAREFYDKALKLNRLDYRIYVGFAEVLIRQNAISDAMHLLMRSLPHAPKATDPAASIADFQSYSLRLLAHGYECQGNMSEARTMLERAVALSPGYSDARYDLAKAACGVGDESAFEENLRLSINGSPAYWHFACNDVSLRCLRTVLQRVLKQELQNTAKAIRIQARGISDWIDKISSMVRALESELASFTRQPRAEQAKEFLRLADAKTQLFRQAIAHADTSLEPNLAAGAFRELAATLASLQVLDRERVETHREVISLLEKTEREVEVIHQLIWDTRSMLVILGVIFTMLAIMIVAINLL